jgi:O-antigen/teichoic acid export membrane protein
MIGGGRWLPAVPLVQVLVWASLLRGISQLFPQIYVATGHPKYAVVDSLVTGTTLVTGFVVALLLAPAGRGAMWVAWVWLLSYPVPLVVHYVMVRRAAPIDVREWVTGMIRPAVGIAALALLLGLSTRLRPLVSSPLISLVLLIAITLAGHALYMRRVLHVRLGDLLPKKATVE